MDVVHIYGGIAQLARVLGSYPIGRRFESHCRYQINKPYLLRWFYKRAFEPLIYGPVVKRLRHRPFTAVTRVRFSSGSPQSTCNKQVLFSLVSLLKRNFYNSKINIDFSETIYYNSSVIFAGVMELADVLDSKSSGSDTVPVRPRSPAPKPLKQKLQRFQKLNNLGV